MDFITVEEKQKAAAYIRSLPEGHPLLTLPNVTLTPYSAGTTVDAFANSTDIIRE